MHVLVHFYLFFLLIYSNNKTDEPKYNFYNSYLYLINAIPNNQKNISKSNLSLRKKTNSNLSKLSNLNLFLRCSHAQIIGFQFTSLN